ncbi:putative MAM and LDL-receptor class A domain-containing protein 1 [Apostichopus japonicus]|uniref:Putative MAM and LDL-receptor class A domain-containing protein 1 n=1 Tax=Stichopus japonicus TaxID=307972 RepID=A0A2G8KZK7_STIJA|nr:putative MAM and LDL-receptor class A domain-containing protein 1 [Apostichopus japonicus]
MQLGCSMCRQNNILCSLAAVCAEKIISYAGSVFAVSQEGSESSRAVLVGPYLAGVDPAKEPCKPLILATLGDGGSRSGVVAVDDIIFSESCLDAKLETIHDLCTYEDGSSSCPWTNDDDRPLQWSVIQGSEAGQNMALRRDHTTQDLSGHYLYLDSMPGHEGLSARYLSKVFQPGSCELVLWYYLGGSNADKLSIYTRQTIEGSLQLEWRKFSDGSRPTWKAAVVTFDQTSNFQIVIEGSAGSFTTSADHVGIDDMGFRVACDVAENAVLPRRREIHDQGRCGNHEYSCSDDTCQPKELFCDTKADCQDESDEAKCPLQCNFDDGLCHWTNDVTAGNSWINGTSYDKYGIMKDHTSKSDSTGLFLYIDVHGLPGYQSAQLVSPKWTLPPQQCRVSLWYYRFGANYGSLSIKVRPEGESDKDLLTLASSLGNFNQWLKVSAPIPNCISTAQILLTAQNSFGNLQHGGYAIDDVSLECDDTCPDHQCSDGGYCHTSSQVCDLTVDCCLDGSDEEHCEDYNTCSFDDGLCVWVQDEHMPWTRHDGVMKRATLEEEHGDIPNGNGAFLEAHFKEKSKGHKSTLHSYVIQPTTGGTCQLRFSYFVQSSTMLTVFIRHLNEEPEDHIWQNSGTDSWKKAEVTLSSDKQFKVMIEASSTSTKEGLVGFDSSSFTPSCDIAEEETSPISNSGR